MNPERKVKLLYISNSPTIQHSGQSRVTEALCNRLCNVYDLRVAGWGYDAGKHGFPFYIYPDSFTWIRAIEDFKPEVLFLAHDVWRYNPIPVIKQRIPELKIIGYFTIDGDPLPEQWFPILRSCDHIIVPSQFGKRVIEERWIERPVSMIPQGVELKDFFLKESKEEFKKSVDKETIELSEKMKKAPLLHSGRFVVFFAGMNQTKKNIGAILDGFVQFAGGKDDVFLYLVLHSHIEEKYGMKVVSDYDITDLYSWIHESGKFRIISESLSVERLARFYKTADVLLSPSIGEGFGLFVTEAMAAKVIPIITDYSAFVEWPDKRAVFLMPVDAFFRTTWNVRRAIVKPETVAEALNKAYRTWKGSPEQWLNMQELNQQRVKGYSWDRCFEQVKGIIESVLGNDDFIDCSVRRLT